MSTPEDTSSVSHFCPECGSRVQDGDRFCRTCGHPLKSASEAPPPAPQRRSRRRLAIIGLALVGLAAASAAVVVLLVGTTTNDAEDEAAAAKGRLTAERARVKPHLDALMDRRDEFFAQERRHLAAMSASRETIARYRRQERDYKAEYKRIEEEFADEWDQCLRFSGIPCPEPDYPDLPKVPGFGKQTKQLRAVGVQLEKLQAGLASVEPHAEVRVVHTQLIASVESLKEEAAHNADVLDEAVEPAQGEDFGTLDKGKLRTLRRGGALPAIHELNRAAVSVIEDLELSKLDYDVPGGRDLDSADHSDDT